ncbi:MAG: transcription termination/antitermination protein NusA [Epsilonproteobacteria bacterium]|nr:transcription termination/antitermination protein NusA [Campylobacterota bacterium]
MERILNILEALANEKNLPYEAVVDAFKIALINTAKRLEGRDCKFDVEVDSQKQKYYLYKVMKVVADDDPLLEEAPCRYISLSEAKEYGDDVEIGDEIRSEIVLEDYGRTAAANLYNELEYHIQRKIEQSLFKKYKEKVGKIIFGTVARVDDEENTYVEIGELKGILERKNRIKGEKFKSGDAIKALLKNIKIDKKDGMILELSRTSPRFLEELLKKEVPEIEDGSVEIVASARIPGDRAKVALKSNKENIDPVGAAVGQKGVRVNAVSRELNGESIDCIEYSPVAEVYVSRALAPAVVKSVTIKKGEDGEDVAHVSVTKDQKAKAIGKNGVNIRLASMLTKYKIELEEVEGESAQKEESKSKDISALESLFKF